MFQFQSDKKHVLSRSQHTLKYYRYSYLIALFFIAVLSIVSQVLVQRHLSRQIDDSHLVNYAARLRTNSQTLVKLALVVESDRENKSAVKDFKTTLSQLKRTHESLRYGNDFLDLPVNRNEDTEELFNIIDSPFKSMLELGYNLQMVMDVKGSINKELLTIYLDRFMKYEKSYLLGMEMIVFDYDRNSRKNIAVLKTIEYTLLAIVLFVLFLEALFIFVPLSRRIKVTFNELIKSKDEASGLAKKLKRANEVLISNHREINDINYALEKATFLVKTDAKGKIIYANDKYCHLTKYSLAELTGKPLFYNKNSTQRSIIYEHINDADNREIWQGEVFDHASDDSGFWLDVTLMPIVNRSKEIYQYLMIGANISERKKTAQKLQILMEEKMKRQEEMQKVLSSSMVAGQEKERKRVAAEIHDGIGQMLTSLKMRIEMIHEQGACDSSNVNEIHTLISSVITETRRIIAELLPSVLEDFGLVPAIQDFIGKIEQNHNITVESNIFLSETKLLKNVELGIYRILQESVNNVLKHADADVISIHLEEDVEFITLEVTDNGKGFVFNKQSTYDTPLGINSHGLSNMKERAKLMDANLEIDTAPDKGTVLRLQIPL